MGSYEKAVTDLVRKHAVPGSAVAVLRDGKLIYARGFGYADVENGTPGSRAHNSAPRACPRQITAAAVMKLGEGGKLKIDDPVGSRSPPGRGKEYVRARVIEPVGADRTQQAGRACSTRSWTK
jgi:CubicO group peptidase (beta-lactamase class C family)